jgi:hypothetical protein
VITPANGSIGGVVFFNSVTGYGYICTTASPCFSTSHSGIGRSVVVQDIAQANGADSVIRLDLTNPSTYTKLLPAATASAYGITSNISSLHYSGNGISGNNAGFAVGSSFLLNGGAATYNLDDEIYLLPLAPAAPPPGGPAIIRVCRNYAVANNTEAMDFNYQPIPNASPDLSVIAFHSDMQDALGKDSDMPANYRNDIFVCLPR